jgi:cytidylate kinase
MIICLGGVSGSGKSTLWRTHPLLRPRGVPCADIADVYRHAESHNISITSPQAFQQLLQDVRTYLTEHPRAHLAVEAFFEPGGWQRHL